MVGVRIIPHLWEKKQEKKKKSHNWKAHPTRKYKNVSLFAAHGVPMFFFKSKATTLGRI